MNRAVKRHRTGGIEGFYQQRKSRGAAVLTTEVLARAQALFDDGLDTSDVVETLAIKRDTLAKAVHAERLHKGTKKDSAAPLSSKSTRSAADSQAEMGVGVANTLARVAASLGELESVTPDFEAVLDVSNGGVLFALPALMASGLLKFTAGFFQLPKGYYGVVSIFLLLAFMALARIKTIESLRYDAPVEWGKLLGLDRIPEVRTLRQKIQCLSQQDQATQWSAALCQDWMKSTPEYPAILYIDGHVRVYHGHQTKLPRHHVDRQKLCCRATKDYWVNAIDGQPFLVINQVVDPGLIQVIENTILPDLTPRVPDQKFKTWIGSKSSMKFSQESDGIPGFLLPSQMSVSPGEQ